MSVARHLGAQWHKQGLEVATSAAPRPWKNFYPYYVKQAYPHLQTGRDALSSNLTFDKVVNLPRGKITGLAKRVFMMLGRAPTIRPCPRYGSNKLHDHDKVEQAGSTGIRQRGQILFRAPHPNEEATTLRGLWPQKKPSATQHATWKAFQYSDERWPLQRVRKGERTRLRRTFGRR